MTGKSSGKRSEIWPKKSEILTFEAYISVPGALTNLPEGGFGSPRYVEQVSGIKTATVKFMKFPKGDPFGKSPDFEISIPGCVEVFRLRIVSGKKFGQKSD